MKKKARFVTGPFYFHNPSLARRILVPGKEHHAERALAHEQA
jgi:hypothetical protein